MYETEVEVNAFSTNAKIKGHLFDEITMKKLGFHDMGDYWHWFRSLKDEVELHVSIYKANPETMVDVAVIDDDFGQYYDYQRILQNTPNHKFALEIREKVENYMRKLQEIGVLSGHNYGEYI